MKIWPTRKLRSSRVSEAVKAAKMSCYSFTKESLRLPINIEEAAARAKCTKVYLARMAKIGRVPGARLMGKQWIFPKDVKILDLDEWRALGLDQAGPDGGTFSGRCLDDA